MGNEASHVERVGKIVLFQKLDASSRKFDDVPDERVARPGDAVRCGSHHMDCRQPLDLAIRSFGKADGTRCARRRNCGSRRS